MCMGIDDLEKDWDLLIIGGGVTGAAILRESVRSGLRVLLVEQQDFAWGTSSRSSKLVHGGLRYLKQGQLLLTIASVTERKRLLREASGLVDPLGFLMPVFRGQHPGTWALSVGLSLYDFMGGRREHTFYNARDFVELVPAINQDGLIGGFRFFESRVDDARLVLRLITEAVRAGGSALNYTAATEILRNARGEVIGATIQDTETGEARTLSTRAIINATGHWAERLHPFPDPTRHLRHLRGSHLVFPSSALPIEQAVTIAHPADRRPVYAIPWEGAVLFGTTDVDQDEEMSQEPVITPDEIAYLMQGLQACFPSLHLSLGDCTSTFAGIRAVLSAGKLSPSSESREHAIWVNAGLITITGGKLTTFRRLAWDALEAAKPFMKTTHLAGRGDPVFRSEPAAHEEVSGMPRVAWLRLRGRYGEDASDLVRMAEPEDLDPIPQTDTLWAELPFAAKHERIRHLSDLLLRRVRVGLVTREGGKAYLDRVRKICEPVLPWDRERWDNEIAMYRKNWLDTYRVPKG